MLFSSVLRCCWLGDRNSIKLVKKHL